MPIRIRRATTADQAAIDQWQRSMESLEEYVDLNRGTARDPEAMRQRYLTWLRQPREKKIPPGWERIDLVAVDEEGAICGFTALNFGVTDPLTAQPEGYVSELHVWPEYRRKGVARGLLEMAEAYAVQRGVSNLSLHVSADGTAQIHLYEMAGFVKETIKMTKRVGLSDQGAM